MKEILFKLLSACACGILLSATVLGQTVVGPGDVLSITSSTAENYLLQGGTLAPTNVTLSGSIELESASGIIRPQNGFMSDGRGGQFEKSTGPTTLNGAISGSGDLEIGNASRDPLIISGDNTYSGNTTITAGQIIVTTSTAFGSSAGTTTILGGSVNVQAPTDERFRIEGGSLFFSAGDFVPSDPITIAGGSVFLPQRSLYTLPVIVDEPGGAITFGFDNTASWTGGSSGVGSLTLGGRVNIDAPLTHDGDLVIDGVILNSANTYTGKTIITDRHVIARADAYGISTTPIEILEQETTVNVIPNGDRGFMIKRGTLNVQTSEPINADIVLGGGFEATIKGVGTFNGPIDYITTPGGGRATIWSGIFNGPVRGTTELSLGATGGVVVLNAANEIEGRARIGGGTVVVNHAEAITLAATQIESGALELNVPATQSPFMTGPEFSGIPGVLRLTAL